MSKNDICFFSFFSLPFYKPFPYLNVAITDREFKTQFLQDYAAGHKVKMRGLHTKLDKIMRAQGLKANEDHDYKNILDSKIASFLEMYQQNRKKEEVARVSIETAV